MNDTPYTDASFENAPAASSAPLPRIGITGGDTNGIGYEIVLKAFADPALLEICTPILYGSPRTAAYHSKGLNIDTKFHIIDNANAAREGELNLLTCFEEEVKVDFGRPTPEAGRAALLSLERACADFREGLFDALVTGPIHKSSIQSEAFRFAGHTEYLQNRLGDGHEALMILFNHQLRVALATTHLPVSRIAGAITAERIEERLRTFFDSLAHDFLVSAPRIAVLGLNPHNGDDGMMGSEEKEIIRPVIEKLVGEGLQCFGPYSADGFFGGAHYRQFDGVLAMYHDQGLAPFKALAGGSGVNFTAGLPVVRTSPDHGTAYDIAGRGVASPDSLRQAIYAAIDLARNRRRDAEARQNPLGKLYHDRREDGDRSRHVHPHRAD